MSESKTKIVGLLARQVRAGSDRPTQTDSSLGTFYVTAMPPKARWDFILELDNGEKYKIGLVTDDPPSVLWFEKHFQTAKHAYHRVL